MVLARNTYRFGLLVIAFSIAEGVRTMGGYGADFAGLGFAIGTLALFADTLAHFARGPSDDGSGGTDAPSDRGDDADAGKDDSDGREAPTERTVPHRAGW